MRQIFYHSSHLPSLIHSAFQWATVKPTAGLPSNTNLLLIRTQSSERISIREICPSFTPQSSQPRAGAGQSVLLFFILPTRSRDQILTFVVSHPAVCALNFQPKNFASSPSHHRIAAAMHFTSSKLVALAVSVIISTIALAAPLPVPHEPGVQVYARDQVPSLTSRDLLAPSYVLLRPSRDRPRRLKPLIRNQLEKRGKRMPYKDKPAFTVDPPAETDKNKVRRLCSLAKRADGESLIELRQEVPALGGTQADGAFRSWFGPAQGGSSLRIGQIKQSKEQLKANKASRAKGRVLTEAQKTRRAEQAHLRNQAKKKLGAGAKGKQPARSSRKPAAGTDAVPQGPRNPAAAAAHPPPASPPPPLSPLSMLLHPFLDSPTKPVSTMNEPQWHHPPAGHASSADGQFIDPSQLTITPKPGNDYFGYQPR